MNNTKQINSNPVKTVLVITVGFLIIYMVTKWQWAIIVSIIIGMLGLLSEYLAKKIEFTWMKLTWILSLIVPNILLTIVFILF
jgi:K+-transporting ATPase A subunit